MTHTTTTREANTLRAELAHYCGSETFYRHPLSRRVIYTEGARHFFEHAGNGAYWFLDILATEPAILAEAQGFASVTLTVTEGKAKILVTDGDKGDGPVTVYAKDISWTDCPDGVWAFYFENMTIMLPGER